jgi:hypothetical protein
MSRPANAPPTWVELTPAMQRDLLGALASLMRKTLRRSEVGHEREDPEDASSTTAAAGDPGRGRAAWCGGAGSSSLVPVRVSDAATPTTPSGTRASGQATAAPAPSGGGLQERSREPASAGRRSLGGREAFFPRHGKRRRMHRLGVVPQHGKRRLMHRLGVFF